MEGNSGGEAVDVPVIDEATRQLRAPWAASVAGILFAVLFTAGLVLMRSQAMFAADDAELARLFAAGEDLPALVGGLYLAPFAGIMFLWFIAVIRDQLGEREDRFFATVFFGSGLLFVALVFVAAAVESASIVSVRYLGQAPPTASLIAVLRALSYTLLFAFATRSAAVFLVSAATIGVRSGAFPRWFAATGYVVAAVLFVVVTFWDWTILLLPGWVGIVSVFLLRREFSLRGAATTRGSAG